MVRIVSEEQGLKDNAVRYNGLFSGLVPGHKEPDSDATTADISPDSNPAVDRK
jgi:hypothetical protein